MKAVEKAFYRLFSHFKSFINILILRPMSLDQWTFDQQTVDQSLWTGKWKLQKRHFIAMVPVCLLACRRRRRCWWNRFLSCPSDNLVTNLDRICCSQSKELWLFDWTYLELNSLSIHGVATLLWMLPLGAIHFSSFRYAGQSIPSHIGK